MDKHITQLHPSGCAIACIAKALNLSYSGVLRKVKNGKSLASFRGFYCKDVVRIMAAFGKQSDFFYVSKKVRRQIYKDGSIVFIKRDKRYPQGHYLCRTKNLWMDP